MTRKEKCSNCKGKGTIRINKELLACLECHGTGHIYHNEYDYEKIDEPKECGELE